MYKNKIEVPPISVLSLCVSYEDDINISKAIQRYVKIGSVFIIYPSDNSVTISQICAIATSTIERVPSTIICFSDTSMAMIQKHLNATLDNNIQALVAYKRVLQDGRIRSVKNYQETFIRRINERRILLTE